MPIFDAGLWKLYHDVMLWFQIFVSSIAADVVVWGCWLPTRDYIGLEVADRFVTKKVLPFKRFAFLDFEASSLDSDSWPIEVGLSWIDDSHEIQTFATLIRPAPHWPEEAWSQASALVHNIPRSELETAPRVEVVAQGLLKALGEKLHFLTHRRLSVTGWINCLVQLV